MAVLALGLGGTLTATGASAAPQPEKTISLAAKPATHVVTFNGHAPFNNGQDGLVWGQLGIDDPKGSCLPSNTTLNDQHLIKVIVPKKVEQKYDTLIRFQIDWVPLINEPLADMALYVYGPDGKLVAASDGSQNQEAVNVTAALGGVYNVLVCAFQTLPQGQDFTGKVITTTVLPKAFPKAVGVKAPSYRQYSAPKGLSDFAGEPSIGNSWKTGHTLFVSNTDVYDVKFNDKTGTSSWKLVNDDAADPSNKVSLDPIGFTDSVTGRTFVSQLYLACSGMSYTDDDFASAVTPSQGCGSVINGFDHQTVGGGPYPQGMGPLPGISYPHAVYYCSQGVGLFLGGATCARSDTGGLAFNPAVQVYGPECNGIHGHVRVGPDGTVYLPNNNCGGKQAVLVSRDGGGSWKVRQIPDSIGGQSDPSVAIGADNTVYYGYADGTGKPRVAVSRSHGDAWHSSIDAGIPANVHNTEFSEMIAGDGARAAFAFLGTPTRGSTQASGFGKNAAGDKFIGGEWHLYISTTYDHGLHWTTVDSTPKDPVQRGCIWNSGGSNPCRNLLDFNDITVTKRGMVMVGFADGCTNACIDDTDVSANKLVDHGTIVRQISGKGLFAKYDPKPVKAAPSVKPGSGTSATSAARTPAPSGAQGTAATAAAHPKPAANRTAPLTVAALMLLLGVTGGLMIARRRAAARV